MTRHAYIRDANLAHAITRALSLPTPLPDHAARTLRRAQLILHRWAELECGDSNDHASWSIERDETTAGAIPYLVTHPHAPGARTRRTRIADRERGALQRVALTCQAYGLHYFHQTDPRGCALYVASEPLTESNYTRGVACVD